MQPASCTTIAICCKSSTFFEAARLPPPVLSLAGISSVPRVRGSHYSSSRNSFRRIVFGSRNVKHLVFGPCGLSQSPIWLKEYVLNYLKDPYANLRSIQVCSLIEPYWTVWALRSFPLLGSIRLVDANLGSALGASCSNCRREL